MRRRPTTLILALGALGLCFATAALATTSIADIIAHPDDWADKQVTVTGTVVDLSLGYQGQSLYTIKGDDRRISIVSPNPAPSVGDRLQVSGQVRRRPPDEEFDFPPVILETGRETLP